MINPGASRRRAGIGLGWVGLLRFESLLLQQLREDAGADSPAALADREV